MRAQISDKVPAILGLLGFAVLMALRTEPASFPARLAIAALAGASLGGSLIAIQRARIGRR